VDGILDGSRKKGPAPASTESRMNMPPLLEGYFGVRND
jgi:hypothetical protein